MRSRGHGLIVRTWSRIVYTRTVALSSSEENEPQRHRGHRGKRHREETWVSLLCVSSLCVLCASVVRFLPNWTVLRYACTLFGTMSEQSVHGRGSASNPPNRFIPIYYD